MAVPHDPTDPDRLTEDQRLDELSALPATGMRRLLALRLSAPPEADVVVGEPPPTDTLGFRWSAVNNLFLSAGEIAADEWRASRAADEEAAEREMRKFVWALPVAPAFPRSTPTVRNCAVAGTMPLFIPAAIHRFDRF